MISVDRDVVQNNRPEVTETRQTNLPAAEKAPLLSSGRIRWIHPEEVVAIVLIIVTIVANVAVHGTLDAHILYATGNTYFNIFRAFLKDFFRALGYCAVAYLVWQLLLFMTGRPVHLVVWRRTNKLWPALRALVVYWICNIAFLNLDGFVHRLNPHDRDELLIQIDRFLFFGHDPLKLLEPLVTPLGVSFFTQVYLTLYLVPLVSMIVFLHQGKFRAFREAILAFVLAVTVGWPGYLIVPAVGPFWEQRNLFAYNMWNIDYELLHGTAHLSRATFPSLHTGLSVTGLILVRRYSTNRLYRIAFTIWVAGIVFSTVYLRWHYVIDVIAGLALAIFVTYLARRINDWWYAGSGEAEGQVTR
jgi:membrane-associated phospholipid phosphatase